MGIGNILIGKKLIGGYVVISLLALLIGAVGIGYMKKIAADNAALYENVTLPIADQGSIAGEFNRVRVNMGKMLLEQNSASIAEYDRKIEGFEKSIKRNLDDSITRADSEEIKNLAQGFQEKYSLFSTSVQELNALAKAGQWSEAKQLFNGSCQESSLSANDALVKLQEASVAHAKVVSDTVKTAQ